MIHAAPYRLFTSRPVQRATVCTAGQVFMYTFCDPYCFFVSLEKEGKANGELSLSLGFHWRGGLVSHRAVALCLTHRKLQICGNAPSMKERIVFTYVCEGF